MSILEEFFVKVRIWRLLFVEFFCIIVIESFGGEF